MKHYTTLFLLMFITIPTQEYPTVPYRSKHNGTYIKGKEHLDHWR